MNLLIWVTSGKEGVGGGSQKMGFRNIFEKEGLGVGHTASTWAQIRQTSENCNFLEM